MIDEKFIIHSWTTENNSLGYMDKLSQHRKERSITRVELIRTTLFCKALLLSHSPVKSSRRGRGRRRRSYGNGRRRNRKRRINSHRRDIQHEQDIDSGRRGRWSYTDTALVLLTNSLQYSPGRISRTCYPIDWMMGFLEIIHSNNYSFKNLVGFLFQMNIHSMLQWSK